LRSDGGQPCDWDRGLKEGVVEGRGHFVRCFLRTSA
jgi:hypothetical protein